MHTFMVFTLYYILSRENFTGSLLEQFAIKAFSKQTQLLATCFISCGRIKTLHFDAFTNQTQEELSY